MINTIKYISWVTLCSIVVRKLERESDTCTMYIDSDYGATGDILKWQLNDSHMR